MEAVIASRSKPAAILLCLAGLFAALSVWFLTSPASAEQLEASQPSLETAPWPQWRGPHRTGEVAPGSPPWPSSFAGLKKVWSTQNLGPSYSGPIVGEQRIFTTETRDKAHEVVSAYDRVSGKKLWQKQWAGAMKVPFFAAKNGSWIRSTPAFDGETLYVGGIQEVLVALDAETGAERWRFDFPNRLDGKQPPFGFVCSPLLDNGSLYLEAADSLFKLDASSGEVQWRSTGFSGGSMANEGSFSSPVFAQLADSRQLIVQTRTELRGVDPENGEMLWNQPVPSYRGMNILTPVVWRDGILTSTYRNNSFFFSVEGEPTGGYRIEQTWSNEAQAYMSSPVVIDDVAYVHLGNGRLTAIDIKTGERHWTTKPFGKYWSMAHQGNRILALDSGGELLLIDASADEFKLLDRIEVSQSETWAHLAVAGDQVIIRELEGLSAWQWGADGGTTQEKPALAP